MAYNYKRTLTVDHTKVMASLTDLPVLVSISDASFKHTSAGGRITSTSGYDIIFTSDANGTTKIAWEIDSYNSSTGVLQAWVKLTVSNTVDTVFYMWFGDASVTTPQNTGTSAPGQVWSSYYAVYHLGDGTTLSTLESVRQVLATNNGLTAAAGQIGGGVSSIHTYNTNIQHTGIGTGWTSFQFSAWCKIADNTNEKPLFDSACSGGGSWGISIGGAGPWLVFINKGGVGFSTAMGLTVGKLYYLTMSCATNGGNLIGHLYCPADGTHVTESVANTGWWYSAGNFWIGQLSFSGTFRNYAGVIDEVRVSMNVHSDNWIQTEYNNQSAPGNIGSNGFIMFGAEMPNGVAYSPVWNHSNDILGENQCF